MFTAQRMHFFTGCVPNDRYCAYLSNKSLSYQWVASILRHPVYMYVFLWWSHRANVFLFGLGGVHNLDLTILFVYQNKFHGERAFQISSDLLSGL